MPRLQHVSIPRPPGEASADQARTFYTNIIGLATKPVPSTIKHLDLVWFIIADNTELHVFAEESQNDITRRHFCLEVENLETIRQRLDKANYETWEPEAIRGRPRFFCRDPFKNIVELTHIEADYADFESDRVGIVTRLVPQEGGKMKPLDLQFSSGNDGAFDFDTGVLKGVLRNEGKSIGLVPVTHIETETEVTGGEGLFNHYRVFTYGKRYGYGARRWHSTAQLQVDGSVEVIWEVTPERPFELRGTYNWVSPNTLDLITTVHADAKLEAYEVFLASYYQPPFIDSQVWATRDPRGRDTEGFVSADQELGVWLAFPRDEEGAKVINDGRWELEPHPLDWTMMPNYALPLAIRRDPETKLTVVVMTQREDCFGIFTPYGEERHYSNYLSLFGHDIQSGKQTSTRSRLIVLSDPSGTEILELTKDFLNSSL